MKLLFNIVMFIVPIHFMMLNDYYANIGLFYCYTALFNGTFIINLYVTILQDMYVAIHK